MAGEYRYLYGVVANKAEPFVDSPPSMISDMALETRQTGDDNMTSKGKDVQVVAPVNSELHDGASVYPHINRAAPRLESNNVPNRENIVIPNDILHFSIAFISYQYNVLRKANESVTVRVPDIGPVFATRVAVSIII